MKIVFPGTRGEIEERSEGHFRHPCLLVEGSGGRLLVDFGKDWEGRWGELSPDKLLLTHAHPDHVGGLSGDPGCVVYASEETWSRLGQLQVARKRILSPGQRHSICGVRITAFPVQHSLRAPAVALRIGAGAATCLYASDVLKIFDVERVLRGVRLYIGDGSSPFSPIVRRQENTETGHASIRRQLEWCAEAGVPEAIFTHCGSSLVSDANGDLAREVCAMGEKIGVRTRIAHDWMEVSLDE